MIDAYRAARAAAAMVTGQSARPDLPAFVPPARPDPATRQGQREIVAATLAAAVIAAGRERVTVAEAVERYREVLGALQY